MDSLITAAARALATGDPLSALKRVALRDDAPALALRGIAMAQLGDFVRARALLKSAGRAFGSREAVAKARCVVAQSEIALVSRELAWPPAALAAARATLEAHGDPVNAAHARILEVRRLLLLGRLDEAERSLEGLEPAMLPPATRAACALVFAGIMVRRLRTRDAAASFEEARLAARAAGIPALSAEIANAARILEAPAARLISVGQERLLQLDEVETLFASGALVIDACRHVVRRNGALVALASRPVLFSLVRALAEAWPNDERRSLLIARAFRGKHADESHRARLRVEIGRLRKELKGLADVQATKRGFALTPAGKEDVVVIAPPLDDRDSAVLALLADGEAWSSSALSMALGASPRTVQRALEHLERAGRVQFFGKGRARRWLTVPVAGFPTVLLLPGPLPGG